MFRPNLMAILYFIVVETFQDHGAARGKGEGTSKSLGLILETVNV